ncbi:hypothetical protein NBRC110019_30990 [Neptunitalea chrysea]|uniref:Uncharacterized protein n=1 Tax=Neptunitalea chrysea TaxID=1647581 RepID=A0A9W6B9M0_9FLAO|nr:hypothetical protein [Neptunitalea chrysea]GLB54058.1 hypothetical protein NBRC110019_30990 [Neptunitalea chrysea]
MSSIKDLKKDINYVLGDIIGAVKEWQSDVTASEGVKGEALIDEVITVFDDLMDKVNAKSVENKKAHFKAIQTELQEKATALVEKVNALS